MAIEVSDLELASRLEENTRAVRTGNLIAVAASLGLDVTEPVARAKALRYMSAIETAASGSDEQ